ncbi:MAG: hypothetical protein Q9166_005972 [cf. Caloplaca sp. 2 TL-2023]
MEHLPLPRVVAQPGPGTVPYVCVEKYDGGSFLTYPERQGKGSFLEAVRDSQYRNSKGMIPTPLVELEAFIQTWLFFGLLTEILGDMFIFSEFITPVPLPNGPQRVVNTSTLLPTINDWMSRIKSSKGNDKVVQYDHIAECLQKTSKVLQATRYAIRPDFNRQIRVSIASVAELLCNAANLAYDITDFEQHNKCPATWVLLCNDDETTAQMKYRGYCPWEIHGIRLTFMTIQTFHLLTWMTRSGSSTRHEGCSESGCRANKSDAEKGAPKHLDRTCSCTNMSVDVSEVINISSRGSLPLLWMKSGRRAGEIQIDVTEARPGLKYIALSHVWADGLGNSSANSLPMCQLRRLYDLILPFFKSQNGGYGVLLWLDTLCCPVEPPEAKNIALSHMQRPYKDAAHVLVLDSFLQDVESSCMHPTEICLRAFTSGWMGRLWTLQEGALARTLWFQFKDTAVDIQQVWMQVRDTYSSDIGRRGLALDAMTSYRGLRNFFHQDIGIIGADLPAVDDALRFRTVSIPTDEPLLIGGLLKLNVTYILDGPESSRMQRLWSLMPSAKRGIPKSILFRNSPKLRQPGFRWAPATFLAFQGDRGAQLRMSTAENHAGTLTAAGLRVCLPAFPIVKAPTRQGLPRNPWGLFDNSVGDWVFCRYEDGTWFQISQAYTTGTEPRKDTDNTTIRALLQDKSMCHTLLLQKPFEFKNSVEVNKALLVHHDNDKTVIPNVHLDMILNVGTKLGSNGVLLEAAYQISQVLLHDELTDQFEYLAMDDEIEQKRHPIYQDLVASLAEKVRVIAENVEDYETQAALQINNRHGNATLLFQTLIFSFFLGNYVRLGQMLPNDTEWCVD